MAGDRIGYDGNPISEEEHRLAINIADRMEEVLRGKTLTTDQAELIIRRVVNDIRMVTDDTA